MIKKLSENVYCEIGGLRGCNHSFVVTGDGVVMIDTPQFPSDAVRFRDEINRHGKLRYVVNIEPHADHFAGAGFFEGTVIGHEGTREIIQSAPVQPLIDTLAQSDPAGVPLLGEFKLRPPSVSVSGRMTLYLGKHTIQLISAPGHTPHQLAVYVPEEKMLFMGDNVVRQMIFMPPDSLPYDWIKSLTMLQELDVEVLVPGHGEICEKSYLSKAIEGVQLFIDTVSGAINKGLSLEEAQKTIDLSGRFPPSLLPADRLMQMQRTNISSLYSYLKKNKS